MDALNAVSLVAYAVATIHYVVFNAARRKGLGRVGWGALVVGWVLQVVDIGVRCVHGQHPASSTAEAMAFIAWMLVGGFLVASYRYRLAVAGAFIAPGALVLLLLARVVPDESAPPGSLGMVHVFLATLGVATFALAAVIEIVYLLQERRLKRKQLDRMGGGAPLDTLDRLAARCVSVGFPVFTLALVTGAIWVARLGVLHHGGSVRPEYVVALGSWVAFGVLLVARAGAGWQGRRAAWLTVGGFSGVLLVVIGYLLRAAV